MEAILDSIDRNGTKHYHSNTCPKCGGTGNIPVYNYVDGGVCFLCGGTGRHRMEWVERTQEYQEKLDVQAMKRHLKKLGITGETIWFPIGDTYSRKEELKAHGARYAGFGWYFNEKPGCEAVEIDVSEIAYIYNGELLFKDGKIRALVHECEPEPTGEYIGTEGDKFEGELECIRFFEYETVYGKMYVYIFDDADGNTLVWKTSNGSIEEHKRYVVSGRIKAHEMYNDAKQTVLTRCKTSIVS